MHLHDTSSHHAHRSQNLLVRRKLADAGEAIGLALDIGPAHDAFRSTRNCAFTSGHCRSMSRTSASVL